MRFSHYRDALRQVIMAALNQQSVGVQAFNSQCHGHALTGEQQQAALVFQSEHPIDATTLAMAANPATAALPAGFGAGLSYQQAAQQILQRAANGPFQVTQLAADTSSRLLAVGMNPAGYGRSSLWTDFQNLSGSWRDLYVWPQGGQPVAKPAAQLMQDRRDHLRRIQEGSVVELMDILFASGRRSIESLLLALPTTDRIFFPAPSPLVQEGADGVIRLLGSRKRLSTHPCSSQSAIPGYAAGYLAEISAQNNLTPNDFISDVINYLSGAGCLNTTHYCMHGLLVTSKPATTNSGSSTVARLLQILDDRRRRRLPAELRGTNWANEQGRRAEETALVPEHLVARSFREFFS
jgi:hypothetical protein